MMHQDMSKNKFSSPDGYIHKPCTKPLVLLKHNYCAMRLWASEWTWLR